MREFSKSFKQIVKFSTALAGYDEVPSTDKLVKQLFEVESDE